MKKYPFQFIDRFPSIRRDKNVKILEKYTKTFLNSHFF